jgi:hypothetical protein
MLCKVHEHAAIDSETLLLLSTRGVGILCVTGQHSINGINPFLFNGTTLSNGNLGLILWQSKNDCTFTDTPQQKLFDSMDVYDLNILEKNDAAIPLIKIIFALAEKRPCLQVNRCSPSSGYNTIVYKVCVGLTPETFNAIDLSHGTIWPALLHASYGWQTIYEGENVDKALRKLMGPGATTKVSHWIRWGKRNKAR